MPYSVSIPITRRTVMRTLCSSGSVYPPFICPSLCPSQCPRVTELWHRRPFPLRIPLHRGRGGVLPRPPGPEHPLDGALSQNIYRIRRTEGDSGGEEGGEQGRQPARERRDEHDRDDGVETVERVRGRAERGEHRTRPHPHQPERHQRRELVIEGDGDDHAG